MKTLFKIFFKGIVKNNTIILTFILLNSTFLKTFAQNAIGDGLAAYENVQAIPFLYPAGTNVKQYATYDRYGGDGDGNWGICIVLYTLPNGEAVIFDEYGPGCLYKQAMNVWVGYPERGNNHIRFYFDDEASPRIDMTLNDYFGGKVAPFNSPFGFMDSIKDSHGIRFADQYYPLRFKKHLVITIVPNSTWDAISGVGYSGGFTCHLFQPGYKLESWKGTGEDNQHVRSQWNNLGNDPKDTTGNINHKGFLTIHNNIVSTILNLSGQSSLAAIKFSLEPYNQATFFSTYIRIYWDDSITPDINLPLGDFFGSSGLEGQADLPGNAWPKTVQNLMFGYNGQAHTMYMYWPMPFWTGAKIEIFNNSGSNISLHYEIQEKPKNVYSYPTDSAGFFFAKKTDIKGAHTANTLFECTGQGHVVARTYYANASTWTENDEFTYIDGVLTPQIHGNGTEDDYCQGWCGDTYNKPLWGALTYGFQNAYRIYLGERYVFYNHIKIQNEGSANPDYDPKTMEVSQVVYYYKKAGGLTGLSLTDSVDVGNQASEQAHSYSISKQKWAGTTSDHYDGYMDNINVYPKTDDGRAFNGYSQFKVKINLNNQGVKLRRRLNTSLNGLQRANVYVDGFMIDRPWQIATASKQSGMQCWRDDDFEIPGSLTNGKDSITIKIEYVASPQKGTINEYFYWVMSHSPGGSIITPPVDVKNSTIQQFRFALDQNYPNPFNPATNISFSLPSKSFVSLKVFDLLGRKVATLVSEEMPAGSYSRTWNATNMSSGIYFYRLNADSFTETKKLVLLR